jgi:hypothetical protein
MKEQVIAYETVLAAPSAGLVVTWPKSAFRTSGSPPNHGVLAAPYTEL